MIKILFVCHGNICRSPMAESYFTWLVTRAGRADEFEIDSAATSRDDDGCTPHHGTVNVLKHHGIPVVPHHARQMTAADARYFDLIIGMDEWNMRNMRRIAGPDNADKLYKLTAFQPDGTLLNAKKAPNVADPWYSNDFDTTWRDVTAGCKNLLSFIDHAYAH